MCRTKPDEINSKEESISLCLVYALCTGKKIILEHIHKKQHLNHKELGYAEAPGEEEAGPLAHRAYQEQKCETLV